MEGSPRRRGERRKRKGRPQGSFAQNYRARSEAKNEAARQQLAPLGPGERPGVVTAAAWLTAAIALSIVIAYAAGAEVDGERPPIAQIVAPALLMGVMSYGLFRARYWAVLGFQTILALLIVFGSLGLVQAQSAKQALGTTALIAICGFLFFRMVKALARIQMPPEL